MADRYCKENEDRLNRQKLEQAGIEAEDGESGIFDEQQCPNCNRTHSHTQSYCNTCKTALSTDTAGQHQAVEEATNRVMEAQLDGQLSEEDIQKHKQRILEQMDALKEEMEDLS
jgi:hypothetical protein